MLLVAASSITAQTVCPENLLTVIAITTSAVVLTAGSASLVRVRAPEEDQVPSRILAGIHPPIRVKQTVSAPAVPAPVAEENLISTLVVALTSADEEATLRRLT
jgi:hypothetical protein